MHPLSSWQEDQALLTWAWRSKEWGGGFPYSQAVTQQWQLIPLCPTMTSGSNLVPPNVTEE